MGHITVSTMGKLISKIVVHPFVLVLHPHVPKISPKLVEYAINNNKPQALGLMELQGWKQRDHYIF